MNMYIFYKYKNDFLNQMGIWFLSPWILMKLAETWILSENFQAIFPWLSLFFLVLLFVFSGNIFFHDPRNILKKSFYFSLEGLGKFRANKF